MNLSKDFLLSHEDHLTTVGDHPKIGEDFCSIVRISHNFIIIITITKTTATTTTTITIVIIIIYNYFILKLNLSVEPCSLGESNTNKGAQTNTK